MQLKSKIKRSAAVLLSAALVCLFGTARHYSAMLPASVTVGVSREGNETAALSFAGLPELTFSRSDSARATASIFGAIPVKSMELRTEETPLLYVGGSPFGIKLLMDGVMVTGLGEVQSAGGAFRCPAADAGIAEGDVIRSADGVPVVSNNGLQDIIARSGGDSVQLTVRRGGVTYETALTPVRSASDGSWRGGMWVRDSIAGIGTMTFIDPSTGEFAGLGHAVCDADTGELIPLQSGEAVPVELREVRRGERGVPGELRGDLSRTGSYGILTLNNGSGVYGSLSDSACRELCSGGELIPLGYRQEAEEGDAYVYTTVEGDSPQRYKIRIESVDYSGTDSGKDMVIRITDEALISASGGIVQGMSGSPIVQNGRLIGAVTHVFVADPTRGYAIFAETMASSLTGEEVSAPAA